MLTGAILDGAKRKRREIDIQRAILSYLGARRILAWQNTTGAALRVGAKGQPYKVRFGIPGTPDIAGIIPGKLMPMVAVHAAPLFIEVKRPGQKPEPHQAMRMRQLRDAGALVFVATCIEDVQRALDAAGIRT